MQVSPEAVEEAAKTLYIRALKVLPPDIHEGFSRLTQSETNPTAQRVINTMITNIAVAEQTDNLLCQDTGVPIYHLRIGRDVNVDGFALMQAIRRGCERARGVERHRHDVEHEAARDAVGVHELHDVERLVRRVG